MEIFACIMCFLNGAALAALFVYVFFSRKRENPRNEQKPENGRMTVQWGNLLNYSGDGTGQMNIEPDNMI